MGNYIFRQIVFAILILGMVLPVPSYAEKTKVFKTPKGIYTIHNYLNKKTKEQSQIILGPDSRSNRLDEDGDGIWDQWELTKANLTVIANHPHRGHFTNLQYLYRMQNGKLRADFIYHEKTKSYYLVGKAFENYKVLKSENIVIGECSQKNDVREMAQEWNKISNQIFTDVYGDTFLKYMIDYDKVNRFIDPSCKTGAFKDSYKTIVSGLAQFMQYSARTEPAEAYEEDIPPRFLSCMDRHGLGVHADRMRKMLYSKMQPVLADFILFKNEESEAPAKPKVHDPDGNRVSPFGLFQNMPESDEQMSREAEFTTDAWNVQKEQDKKLMSKLDTPLLKCQYRPISSNGVQRAEWSENNQQITFNRLAGDKIPKYTPEYIKNVKLSGGVIPEHNVDAYDYARAFFHEMIHSSFIQDENFTESIENCCGAENGYEKNNPACQAMMTYVQKASVQQSFVYALMQKNPDAYSNYHQNLIRQIGSIDTANQLEGEVINKFKTQTDQCNKNRSVCGLTLERVLMDSVKSCLNKVGNSTAGRAACESKFNKNFYDEMHGLYEKECNRFNSARTSLNCKSLATSFLNVFGECGTHLSLNFENKWDVVLNLIFGKLSLADDPEKCVCFEVTNEALKEYADLGGSSGFNSDEHSVPYVPGSSGDKDEPFIRAEKGEGSGTSLITPPGSGSSPEDGNGDVPSYINKGQTSDNYNRESQRPVSREMLGETAAVPNSQLTKEFTRGYERRTTSIVDSAISIYNKVQREILPSAYAQTASDLTEIALNQRMNANQFNNRSSSVRISDPFAGGSESASDSQNYFASSDKSENQSYNSSGSMQNSQTNASTNNGHTQTGNDGSNNSNSSSNSGSLVANGANGSSGPVKKRPSSQNSYAIGGSGRDNRPGKSNSESKGQLAASKNTSSSKGDDKGTDKVAAASGRGSENGHRRAPASKGGGESDGQGGAGRSTPKEYVFANTDELLKFLSGSYRNVVRALSEPEFLKILIDHKVKVINHSAHIYGSRKPDYVLQFNKANGSLNIVKWK